MRPATVVLADDHRLLRESLAGILERSGKALVIGQAGDGRHALQLISDKKPEIAIVDISMPELSGIEVVRRAQKTSPNTRCLVLTMHEEDEYVVHLVRAGACGYLLKDSATEELLKAMECLIAGQNYFGVNATQVLADQFRRPQGNLEDPYGGLTDREREVFHLLIQGQTGKEIAADLDLSIKTIDNHRASIMRKLGVRNAVELVRYAARKGLLD